LAQAIVADAEGATHRSTLSVEGLRDDAEARRVAKAVADSPLVKTAIFGADPNWGRFVLAAGSAVAPGTAWLVHHRLGGLLPDPRCWLVRRQELQTLHVQHGHDDLAVIDRRRRVIWQANGDRTAPGHKHFGVPDFIPRAICRHDRKREEWPLTNALQEIIGRH